MLRTHPTDFDVTIDQGFGQRLEEVGGSRVVAIM